MSSGSAPERPLRLGTRGSALALHQSGAVAREVTARSGREVEIMPVVTAGDASSRPIEQLGTTGVFVTAVREALLAGEVDFVVHSFKDLPTEPAPGLVVAAVPPREDVRDGLVTDGGTTTLDGLPWGARIGTGAPRRVMQLRACRPDLVVRPLRGNVDSRVQWVRRGELEGVLVAMAGLCRLGQAGLATPLPVGEVLPAPAQGALALECRADDAVTLRHLAALDDPATRVAVIAERTVLADLRAGCSAPVAALAEVGTRSVTLVAAVGSPDGVTVIRKSASAPRLAARDAGHRVAARLLAAGAEELVEEWRRRGSQAPSLEKSPEEVAS